jgi:hypothetical protein
MKYGRSICALALCIAWLPNVAAAFDPYWAFTYKGITVTAVGSADRAKSIAHNLHRLDLALATVLGIQAEDWRAPTRVYAVPQSTFNLLWRKTDISYSSISFPWFLVHQVVIEEKYHSNFLQYFSQLDQGDEEPRAFAASFGTDYENVDKEMQHALNAKVIKIIKVQVPVEPDSTEPRRLSDSEAQARLAVFAALHGEDIDGAVKLANDALAADPKNEDALIALARTQLRQHLYPAALQYADRLCALEHLSQNAAAQCAKAYADMFYGGAAKNTTLGVDAPALADRSRKYFEMAISADPEDLASWAGMTYLLTATHNVEYAKDFLPRAKHVWATHSRNEHLARTLAGLCATTGDLDTAIKFATVWQKNALSGSRRAEADAYLSRLKATAERKALSEAPAKNASPGAPMPTP